MVDELIRCRDVVKIYPSLSGRVQALRGVDLTVSSGDVVALVGPSGSGKSSLLRIIAGLDQPSAGLVAVGGVDFASVPRRRRRITRARLLSHVYQQPTHNLLRHQTALQQVERVAVRRNCAPAVALEMLCRLGLEDRADHRPAELSGGEQQRVAFARAAVGAPALIIADEPTAELDTVATHAVLDIIAMLAATGITVLIATHDPQVLERVRDVVVLRDGMIAARRRDGDEFATIDQSGRVQLPPDIRREFPTNEARITWDGDHATLRRP